MQQGLLALDRDLIALGLADIEHRLRDLRLGKM